MSLVVNSEDFSGLYHVDDGYQRRSVVRLLRDPDVETPAAFLETVETSLAVYRRDIETVGDAERS